MADFINLNDIARRIKDIQEQSGLNANDFCKDTDLSPSSFSQIISGKQKLNVDIINKVVLRWGNKYDPMWILFGRQTNESNHSTLGNIEQNPADGAMIAELMRQAEEIGYLKEALSNAKAKTIDRITVFYTDQSFANYKLEG